jgi:hypothetical protein
MHKQLKFISLNELLGQLLQSVKDVQLLQKYGHSIKYLII